MTDQPDPKREPNPTSHPQPSTPVPPPPPRRTNGAKKTAGVETPWMTLDQACVYTRRSRETVRRAAVEFQRTGDGGLRGFQPKANACHSFHRDDLDRWVMGLPPKRGAVRAA